VRGTTTIREKIIIHWDKTQTRVPGRGSGLEKKRIKNDSYYGDLGEERNPIG
jgi:hypothetical protein